MADFLNPPDDLTKLEIISPTSVKALLDDIHALQASVINGRKVIVMVGTGGTISMHAENGIRIPHHEYQLALLQQIDQRLNGQFLILVLDAFCIDSSQMDYRYTRDLAIAMTYLWNGAKGKINGFLVAHGTDTMTYSGAALSLMMGQGLPFSIVMTGAQKPMEDPVSDGPTNIKNALLTLGALHDKNMAEVVIVFGNRAMLATSAEKVDDVRVNAFEAPRHEYIAHFDWLDYPLKLAAWLKPRREMPFKPLIWTGNFSKTYMIKSMLGLAPDMVRYRMNDPEINAVILYSYGAGTVYQGLIDAILPVAQKRNMPVFIVNPVHGNYKVNYESASIAVKSGAVPLNMSLSAALAKIEIGYRLYKDDLEKMTQFIVENYVGEVPSTTID